MVGLVDCRASRDRARCPTGRTATARRGDRATLTPASLAVSGIFSVVVLKLGSASTGRGGIDSVTSSAAGRDGAPMSGLSRSRSIVPSSLSRATVSPSDVDEPNCDGTGITDCGSVLAPSGSATSPPSCHRPLRRSAGAVHRVVGIDLRAELLRLGPFLAFAARQREQLGREQLEALDVAPLGIDLEQLGADGEALGVAAHRLLEDLLGLQVAAVGEIDVGLGDRIDVADRVELRQRIGHRRRSARRIAGVDALAAARSEERIGLQATFQERRLAAVLLRALRVAIGAVAGEQQHQRADAEVERIAAGERVDEARAPARDGSASPAAALRRRLPVVPRPRVRTRRHWRRRPRPMLQRRPWSTGLPQTQT